MSRSLSPCGGSAAAVGRRIELRRGLFDGAEGVGELRRGLGSVGGVFGERPRDESFEFVGGVGAREAQGRGLLLYVLEGERRRRRRLEGRVAGEHLVENHAEAVDVGARIDVVVGALLGRHVARRADQRAGLGERVERARGVLLQLGDAEVQHLDEQRVVVVAREDDVRGLEVAVDDAAAVRVLDAVGDLAGDGRGFVEGERARALQSLAERLAFDEFHDDVGLAARERPVVVGAGDVRVVESRGGARLALEALRRLLVGDEVGQQQLDRRGAFEFDVHARVDRAHPAAPDQLVEPVLVRDQARAVARRQEHAAVARARRVGVLVAM